MTDAVEHALDLVAPAFLRGALRPDTENGSSKRNTLPSQSTLQRHELSLDLALIDFRRQTYQRDVTRFAWCDKSPQCTYDFLWSQVHEIKNDELVATCQAMHSLTHQIRDFVGQQDNRGILDEPLGMVHGCFLLHDHQHIIYSRLLGPSSGVLELTMVVIIL